MNRIDADLFRTLAWYNTQVNAAIAALLEPHTGLCVEPDTTYYGSILGLLSHVTLSDITWLRRVGEVSLPELEFSSLSDVRFADPAGWWEHRWRLDRAIEARVHGLSADELAGEVGSRNTKGREFRQPLWQILMHMFNHQTHHRGQLAQVLDDRGIDNDFSNLIWYLRD